MRSETKNTTWRPAPVRVGARRRRMMNLGQFIRSLVFAALGVVAVVMIALLPAHDSVGGSAPHDSMAGQLAGRSILHFPR